MEICTLTALDLEKLKVRRPDTGGCGAAEGGQREFPEPVTKRRCVSAVDFLCWVANGRMVILTQ